MRVFIAVDINDEMRRELTRIQNVLSGKLVNAKWVKPQNLHITIKFLGEIEPEAVGDITLSLEKPIKETPSFYIELGELGVFPNMKRPAVFWAGLKKGREEMSRLNELIQNSLYQIGYEKDSKPFSPHITLARFRKPVPSNQIVKAIESVSPIKKAGHTINGVSIYESTLKPKGPEYKHVKYTTFAAQ